MEDLASVGPAFRIFVRRCDERDGPDEPEVAKGRDRGDGRAAKQKNFVGHG